MWAYEGSAWILAGFLTVYGILFLWISTRVRGRTEGTGFESILNPRLIFQMFALLYLALGQFSMYGAVLLNIEQGSEALCENVVNTSTYDTTTNVTTYTWVNSCAGDTAPSIQGVWFTLLTWILWIDIWALAIGSMLLFFRQVRRW